MVPKPVQNDYKPIPNPSQTDPKPTPNQPQTDPKPTPNRPQTKKIRARKVFQKRKMLRNFCKKCCQKDTKTGFCRNLRHRGKNTKNDVKS